MASMTLNWQAFCWLFHHVQYIAMFTRNFYYHCAGETEYLDFTFIYKLIYKVFLYDVSLCNVKCILGTVAPSQ